MSRFLIIAGLVLVAMGLLWPLWQKLGLGQLPGDIHLQRDGLHFYFPLTTSIIISLVVSLIIWLLRK